MSEFALTLWCSIAVLCRSQTSFTITAPPPITSNIIQVIPFTSSLDAFAGVLYLFTQVTSSAAFFGTKAANVNAKLVDAGATSCSASTSALLGSPFDGATRPIALTQVNSRWGQTKFVVGGSFTLCVSVSAVSTVLPILISVRGMLETSNKMFCMHSTLMNCRVFLKGYGLSGRADGKLALVAYPSGVCGTSSLSAAFSDVSSTAIQSDDSSETHDFGSILSSVPQASYVVCYCPSYQAVVTAGGEVCSSSSINFVQAVGTLILMSVSTSDPNTGLGASVYTRAAFNLNVICGTGGCSQDLSPRIKVIETNPSFNLKPYYDTHAGCRAALQSTRYIAPLNCDFTATGCVFEPSTGVTSLVFTSIQLDNELMNSVSVVRSFDVCYCDSNCAQQASWFMIGSIPVLQLSVSFTYQNFAILPFVNTPGSIKISGASPGSLRTSGSKARLMKLIADDAGTASPARCANELQSSQFVTGYECYSATSCDSPSYSTSSTVVYGRDLIEFTTAGWTAVCYCNESCGSIANWSVVGRLLIRGPSGNQQWKALSGLTFDIEVTGWGLSSANSVFVYKKGGGGIDCSNIGGAVSVSSASGSVLGGGSSSIVQLVDGYSDVVGGSGTNLYFSSPHGLASGDRISLSGISTGSASFDAMFNSEFSVALIDSIRVNINVQFAPGTFPTVHVSGSTWWRSSVAIFRNLFFSDSGSYTVCYSPAGTAGTITVTDPPFGTGSIDLSNAISNVPSVFGLEFTPNIAYKYIKIVFTDPTNFTPLLADGSPWISPFAYTCSDLFVSSGLAQDCEANIDLASSLYLIFITLDSLVQTNTCSLSLKASWTDRNALVMGNGSVSVWVSSSQEFFSAEVEVIGLKPPPT